MRLNFKNVNFPTRLTLIRMVFAPLLLPFLIVYLLPLNIFWMNGVIAFLFVLLGLTDFFDGYFARKHGQETDLGRVLDPIADKFLVYSTLIGLMAIERVYFFWVVIFIGREFLVMGLRNLALLQKFTVNVSSWGKLKTAAQFSYLTVALINPYHMQSLFDASFNVFELVLLVLSLILTLFSAWKYYKNFIYQSESHIPENNVADQPSNPGA